RPSAEEIICLPDGRFGFKVVDPATGKRKAAFEYDEVRGAEEHAEDAERLRLYYVAMTRAIDRLIVSGSVDGGARDARTPLGWVLDAGALAELGHGGVVREDAGLLVGIARFSREAGPPVEALAGEEQLSLFAEVGQAAAVPAPQLAPLEPIAPPPAERVRR